MDQEGKLSDLLHCEVLAFVMHDNSSCWQGTGRLQALRTGTESGALLQVENVKTGKPYIMFGDGQLASCKPISEADLAAFMADCVAKEDKVNQVLPIGGEAADPRQSPPGGPAGTLPCCSAHCQASAASSISTLKQFAVLAS